MEYSEEAYQQLLKMRDLGKKNYDDERYSKSLISLGWARTNFEKARVNHETNNTPLSLDLAHKARDAMEHARAVATHFHEIMQGKRSDPTMTDTMYELRGYKMKEESDEIFSKWCLDFFGSKGYWTPGTH